MRRRYLTSLSLILLLACSTLAGCSGTGMDSSRYPNAPYPEDWVEPVDPNQEAYDDSEESPFKDVALNPLSTFSSDVDTASYSNLRRQVNAGYKPKGVRIEELVNYFTYDYPAPSAGAEHPFATHIEVADCPWNDEHKLAMISVQATKATPTSKGNNIVFLIDVSGSMSDENKLPLLIDSFSLLVEGFGEEDVVSIVTYAGSDRIVADSIPGSDHRQLTRLLERLESGGSTAGAKGLETAYQLAEKNFIEGGNNRVILATDGDFNVGVSSAGELKDLIEAKRASGVYISVLGFGMGNLKDNNMEAIADYGNGNYAYIDTLNEARKVLVNEFDSTMFVVAQDLKFQVEFNHNTVRQYRLIGYNNRRMDDEDFTNDAKDAGDIGAGHSVTAFYELVPSNGEPVEDGLTYQDTQPGTSTDFFTVSIRYKQPGAEESTEVKAPAGDLAYTTTPTIDFVFASAVAEFGLIASESAYQGQASLDSVSGRAGSALGTDDYGLRSEFLTLVSKYAAL